MHLQLFAAVFLPEFAECFFLDLADPLASEAEALTNFFEGQRMFAADPKIEAGDFRFAGMEKAEGAFDVDLEGLVHQRIVRRGILVIRKHVEQA